MRRLGLMLVIGVGPGCGGDDDGPGRLVAVAGADRTVAKGSAVTLDGTDSSGPDDLTYAWTLAGPDGSTATLLHDDTAATTFTTDREGTYTATLIVGSGYARSAPDPVVITAENTPPTADAGDDVAVYTGNPLRLQGGGTDPTDDALELEWTIVSAPPGSEASLDDPTSATPFLVPDRDGEYELELVVRDESLESEPDRITVLGARFLEHTVVDADYSGALDLLVMASDDPAAVYIRDPVEGTETVIGLPSPPTSISVGPDGAQAAVGHDGAVSLVSLTTGALLATHPVAPDVADVVLAGNGYAYVVARAYGENDLVCLDVSTGGETLADSFGFNADSRVKLHPSGTSMYHSNPQNFSPSDIARWNLGSGIAEYMYDSPYHGEYQGCGDLWIAVDGRIFTRCADVFLTSDDPAADMLYAGDLGGVDFVLHLDHSATANKVAVVPDTEANPFGDPSLAHSVRLYEGSSLVFERRIELLPVIADERARPFNGRFAFMSADGARLFVVARASQDAGTDDVALYTYEL